MATDSGNMAVKHELANKMMEVQTNNMKFLVWLRTLKTFSSCSIGWVPFSTEGNQGSVRRCAEGTSPLWIASLARWKEELPSSNPSSNLGCNVCINLALHTWFIRFLVSYSAWTSSNLVCPRAVNGCTSIYRFVKSCLSMRRQWLYQYLSPYIHVLYIKMSHWIRSFGKLLHYVHRLRILCIRY